MPPSQFAILSHLGLTQDEINIYAACVTLGDAKAADIAKRAKLTRTAVYRHLETLIARGLLSESIREGRTRYSPCDAEMVQKLMEERIKDIQHALPLLKDALSHQTSAIPKFRFFPEAQGLKIVLEEILRNPTKNYRVIGSIHDDEFLLSVTEAFMLDWSRRRIAAGVYHQSLRPQISKQQTQKLNPLISMSGMSVLRHIRYVPPSINFNMLMYLYDGKIAFMNGRLGRQFAVVLTSTDMYESLNSVFEFLWGVSEPAPETG